MSVRVKGLNKETGETTEVEWDSYEEGGGDGGSSGEQLLRLEALITPAEFYDMNAVPKELVPAVPGKSIYLHTFSLIYNIGTAFVPNNPHLVDMPSGGALFYWAPQMGTVGKAMMNGVTTAWVSLGAGSDGQPLGLSFDVPFTAGALSEDALAVGWYCVL